MADEINIPIRSKYDDKGAKQALKDAKELDKLKPELKVTADVKSATKDIDGLMKKVDLLDKDAATILLTSNATDIAQDMASLLTDIDRLDANDPEVTVKAEQINSLKGDLDQIEAKVREVNQVPVDINTAPAKHGLDEVGKSAGSSKSVLANMVGNSAQDLGALGGIAGSAGVAFGQMGEYMADAASEGEGLGSILRNFAGVAGPIAAISVGVALVSREMEKNKRVAKENEDQVESFFKAIQDGSDILDVFVKQVRDTGTLKLPLVGDILPELDALNLKVEDFSRLAKLPRPQLEAWAQSQAKLGGKSKEFWQVITALDDANTNNAKAQERAKITLEALGGETAVVVEHVKGLNDAYAQAAGDTGAYSKAQQGLADTTARVDEIIRQADDAARDFADTMSSADFTNADLSGAVAGMEKFHDQFFGLADIMSESEQAWDDFGKSLKDNGKSFDLTSQKGRDNQKALEDLSRTIETKMAKAYTDADGDQRKFRDNATRIAQDTLKRLQREFGLSAGQAQDLGKRLGLLPKDIATRYKLNGTEEARTKIGLLQTAINNLPKDVQTRVTQQIIKGDYQGALATVQGYYNSHPASVDVNARAGDTSAAQRAMQDQFNRNPLVASVVVRDPNQFPVGGIGRHGGMAGPGGMLVAEAGPEFVRWPNGTRSLLSAPTVVPAGTQVTSTAATAARLDALEREAGRAGLSAPTTNVTVVLPRGHRERDVLAAAERAARRSGGLYRRSRR